MPFVKIEKSKKAKDGVTQSSPTFPPQCVLCSCVLCFKLNIIVLIINECILFLLTQYTTLNHCPLVDSWILITL